MTKKSDAPAIRFKGFSDAWEQRKFSELVQIERGGSPRPIDDFITDAPNGLNWVKIGDAPTQGNYITKTAEKIRPEGLSKTREVHPGDLILSNSMSFGKPYIMGIDGCIHDGWLLIRNTYGVFDLTFLCHLLGTPQMLSQYRSLAAGSTVNNLNKELVENTVVTIPSITEQRVLGDYLEQLDNLITLHQRKCVFLFGFFQAFISMIFTASTFSWEQRKLGDVVKEITRNEPESEAPIMMITANNGFIEQSERYAFNNAGESLKKYILLKKGELAYNHGASKLRPYGSCFALTTAENARIPFVYHCFSAENQNAEFMSIELNGAEIENQLRKIVSSGARMDGLLNISFDEYTSVSVLLPGTEEQDRIADFFRHLDNLITLHQRECISFTARAGRLILTANKKRNTSSWEQRKLSEITDKVTEKNAGLQYVETFTNSAEFGIISQRDFFDHDIAKLGSLDGYYIVKNEDFVYNPRISTSAPVGPINRNKLGRTGVMSPLYTVFRPHDIDTTYLEYFFKCGYWHSFMNFNGDSGARSDRFSIRDNVFFQMPIPIPDIDEQRKIGELLTCLDNLITLHQRKPFLMKWRTSDANRNQTNRLVL